MHQIAMWAEHVNLSRISGTRLAALSCGGPPERQLAGHNTTCHHTRSSVPTFACPKPSHVRRSPHLALVGDRRTLPGSRPSLRVLSLTPPAVAANRNASLRAGKRTPSGSVAVLHTHARSEDESGGHTDRSRRPNIRAYPLRRARWLATPLQGMTNARDRGSIQFRWVPHQPSPRTGRVPLKETRT